jgi:hypothetical protein
VAAKLYGSKNEFENPFKLISPRSFDAKTLPLPRRENQFYSRGRSAQGALAIVTNVGRDAVDVFAAFGRTVRKGTAKSWGLGAPTLALNRWRIFRR